MPKKTINLLVDGGKANAGPPLGPTLAPLKMDINKVVSDINDKTKEFAGMKVPVKLIIDPETKDYEIIISTPSVSQLIKKELKLEKLARTPWAEEVIKGPTEEKKEVKEGEKKEEKKKEKKAEVVVKKAEKFEASLSMDQIVKITKTKTESLKTHDFKKAVKQVVSTCLSCGVQVENKNPKEMNQEIDEGKWDSKIK